ncbi:MAG: sensor histidine kinase [Pirellulales bacterium]|nr:sensor histidine kinase [Pirellulales bacterium]
MATASKSGEAELAALRQQLLRAQRMAALGELVGTTTHEFNNVLTTILNYAKLGLRNKDEATRDKAFDRILSAALRAEKITNSVLGMARNRSDEFAPTELEPLVEQTLTLLEREMQKYRIAIRKEFQPAPPARAVGNQIQQVLLNLMTNARQAMAGGGELLVRVHHDEAANLIDITVRDPGCGIPREHLPKIFERFFTTKSGPDATGKGGAGVGLAMCRDIVEAHQGRIRVESAVGKGTAFTVRLPVWQTPEPAAGAAAITPLGAPGLPSQSPLY